MNRELPGRLYTLDGIDGVGKTSQIERLAQRLRQMGRPVQTTRDPGGTEVGLRLRELLLQSDLSMDRRTEAMLFMASRCEMVAQQIRPWLRAGNDVISDRFLLANVVYQSLDSDGTDADLSTDDLWNVGRWSIGDLPVYQTFLLDLPAVESIRRVGATRDRMEARGLAYLEAVRKRYLRELPQAGGHAVVIDASRSIDEVAAAIEAALRTDAST